MKITKLTVLFVVALQLVLIGCESIVDEMDLKNTTDVNGVELIATQSTPGGNEIELNMATPGINGYWNINIGKAFTNKVKFSYPIPGTTTFTYIGTLGSEFFEKTIDVQIDQLDHPIDQDWYDLVSENTSAGKTWVYKGGPSPDGQLWYYMSPPNDAASWATAWWNAGGECCPPEDASGSMTFDLNGAANFTYRSGPSATPVKGSFAMDVANAILKIDGANIPGGTNLVNNNGKNSKAIYTIISLTEDELILYAPTPEIGTGWTYIFKPE